MLLFSEAPLAHPQRETALCPAWPSPLEGLQRPQVRLRFERKFLPQALREHRIDDVNKKYRKLSTYSAQRVLRFWQARDKVAAAG